jgi:hypothetical protein
MLLLLIAALLEEYSLPQKKAFTILRQAAMQQGIISAYRNIYIIPIPSIVTFSTNDHKFLQYNHSLIHEKVTNTTPEVCKAVLLIL